jgi:hypothetical protein
LGFCERSPKLFHKPFRNEDRQRRPNRIHGHATQQPAAKSPGGEAGLLN